MIFRWLLDNETSVADKLLMSLWDHEALSARQFCILADWKISKLRVVIHRIRNLAKSKDERALWIQKGYTEYPLDRSYYRLAELGLKYCCKITNQQYHSSQFDHIVAQHKHILGLNEILVRLVESGVDRHKITWLATREATDYLLRLYRLQKQDVKKKELIRPDARLILGNKSFWIEYDNNSEGAFIIEQKFRDYIDLLNRLQNRWIDTQGKERPPLDNCPVVWVAPNAARKKYLQSLWESFVNMYYTNHWKPRMFFFHAGEDTEAFIKTM